MNKSLKEEAVTGLVWSSLERFAVQGIEFLVILFLARLLTPNDFGLVGMLSIFIAIARSLVDSGFSQALIRKQRRTNNDNCTVFIFNVFVSICLYCILFLASPWVADFYNEPELCKLMRFMCFVIVIDSFSVVHRALFISKLDFKTQTKSSFISSSISGILSIILAKLGFGYWALVSFQLVTSFFNTILLWYYSSWRPQLMYSYGSFKELFSFGSKLMLSGIIDTIYNNLYQIVIGKFFSASSLGHFSQAKNFSQIPAATITSILQRVTYPTLCRFQDNNEQLKDSYGKVLRISAFVFFPLMCGIAGVSSPLVHVLIGSKWEFASVLIVPLCFSMMWYPIHAINLSLLQVKGRSDIFLRIEIIKKVIGVIILFSTIPFGLTVMCWFRVVNAIISLAINTYYTGILIEWGFWQQFNAYFKSLILSFLLFFVIFYSMSVFYDQYIKLVVGILSGIFYVLLVVFLLKFREVDEIKSILAPLLRK